ncbi:MAG TPA: AMP-binding protein [Burkholderiaceae bacterium]|nr:AMP-binding protein [Burkholderiaceae bacterium]
MRDQYRALYESFRWNVPAEFNIATVCSRRWAHETSRIALHCEDGDGQRASYTYAALQGDANRLSNALGAMGVRRGDRVALVLPQRPETAIAHIAIYQLGAVAMPLSLLFGPEALEYRLENSGAVVAILDASAVPAVESIRARCPELRNLIVVGEWSVAGEGWSELLSAAADRFECVATRSSDPAVLIYTSGTTGPPKGALMPHSALIGNLPGFVASQNWFPQAGDVFWSPADWAWTGGLMDALLPTLYFGFPIVGTRGRFDPERAFELMERYGVTNTFLFPTALKMMMKTVARPHERYRLKLRAVMSAGEAVGATVYDWCRDALGITVNEMFGQTEMNYIVGNSHEKWPAVPGSMGRPYPGHRIAVIDDDGNIAPDGETGEVAVHRRDIHGDLDPIFFIGYWRNEAATERKFTGDWCRTGDLASRDRRGYLWYQGRADDMFKAAGYRIGPSEIENCLLRHAAVANVAVVPKPDAERGAVVKAFIVLAAGHTASATLIAELQAHVRGKLAPYEYPKDIEFVDALPMTTTGKVQRRVLRELEATRAAQGGAAA